MLPTLAGVVLLVFFLFKTVGGDPAEILGGLNTVKSSPARPCARWRRRRSINSVISRDLT
ncbi:MAG TPA: hypothetical protein PL196_00165 [Burkholderiaceae bacterium]|nr:hypothetical protein [Burkholderiaceae bacterium]